MIGRLAARRFSRKRAVAVHAVGAPAAVQVVAAKLGAWNRPISLVAPLIDAHHEDAHERRRPAIPALETPVEEAQLRAIDIGRYRSRLVAEIDRSHQVLERHRVAPWPDDQALAAAGEAGCAPLAHPEKIAQRAALKDVVPSADVQGGDVDLRVMLL